MQTSDLHLQRGKMQIFVKTFPQKPPGKTNSSLDIEARISVNEVKYKTIVDYEPGNGHEPTFFRVALLW